jgi:hypothetical protein
MALSGIGSNSGWYQIDQAWAQSRQRIAKQFLQQSETFSSALTSSAQDQISGMATLAGQAALKRIKSAIANHSTSNLATGNTSRYKYTSPASVLSNSNVLDFFA